MTCLVYICSQSCTVEGGIGNEGWNPLGNTHLYVWHRLPQFNVEMWIKWCASWWTRWHCCTSALSLKYTTHVHIYRPSSIAICIYMTVSNCIYGLNAKLLQTKLQGIVKPTHRHQSRGTVVHTRTHTHMQCGHTLTQWRQRSQTEHPQDWAKGQMCLVTPFSQTPFRMKWRLMWNN